MYFSLPLCGIHIYVPPAISTSPPLIFSSPCSLPYIPTYSPLTPSSLPILPSSLPPPPQMVFSPLIPASQAPDVVLHHHLPLGTDLGPSLLADWESKLALLSMALELLHYLEDPLWPLASSSRLSHFGYDSLTVSYGEHSVSEGGTVYTCTCMDCMSYNTHVLELVQHTTGERACVSGF